MRSSKIIHKRPALRTAISEHYGHVEMLHEANSGSDVTCRVSCVCMCAYARVCVCV